MRDKMYLCCHAWERDLNAADDVAVSENHGQKRGQRSVCDVNITVKKQTTS